MIHPYIAPLLARVPVVIAILTSRVVIAVQALALIPVHGVHEDTFEELDSTSVAMAAAACATAAAGSRAVGRVMSR